MRFAWPVLVVAMHAVALAETRGTVVRVHDGDCITVVLEGDRQVRVRLAAIDAPELGQAFGRVARDRLAELVGREEVELAGDALDRYGRRLSHVIARGQDVNATLVAEGMAWQFTRYDDDPDLADAQRQAREARRGLWRDPEPVPPWEWRASERARRAPR